MTMAVRAYPLRSGLDSLRNFGRSLTNERRPLCDDFFRRHGVMHESWHLQSIDGVQWVICCTRLHDRQTTEKTYGGSRNAFDMWFKEQVEALTGVNPNATPLGLPSQQVFCWDDMERPGASAL